MRNQRAAASAQGESRDVLLLREVRSNANGVAARTARRANRQSADLLRRGDVPVQQCWREICHSYIVKAITGLFLWQQCSSINLQREKIPDGVLIFRSVQAPKRFRSPGIWMSKGRGIKRGLQLRKDRLVGIFIGPLFFCRRHLTRPQLSDNFLPNFRMPSHIFGTDAIEIQIPLLRVAVVAVGTISTHKRVHRGDRAR